MIIDLLLGKIGMGSWAGIARKVQHDRDLHAPWNIGTNRNIDEEKFHNFIDDGGWVRGKRGEGAPKLIWHIN